jgi:hypothetical protein
VIIKISVYGSTALMDLDRFFSFLIYTQLVGLLGWGISLSQDRCLHTEQHKHRINAHRHLCHEWDSNPRTQCLKTVNALDCAAIVIGIFKIYNPQKPTKCGLLVYVIADSTNGYVFGLIPCYGSTATKSLMHPVLTFTSRISLELINKIQNITHEKRYNLYTERFYANLDLAGMREMSFYCDTFPKKAGLYPKCSAIRYVANRTISYLIKVIGHISQLSSRKFFFYYFLCIALSATDTCIFSHPLIMHSLYVVTSSFTLSMFHYTVLILVLNLRRLTA